MIQYLKFNLIKWNQIYACSDSKERSNRFSSSWTTSTPVNLLHFLRIKKAIIKIIKNDSSKTKD